MKKANVLQLTIVLVAVVLAVLSLQYFCLSAITIIASFLSGDRISSSDFIISNIFVLVAVGLQFSICWLLLTKSSALAAYLHKKSNMGTGFSISSKPNDLLFILIITIGIYQLLSNISPFFTGIFRTFKEKGSGGASQSLYENSIPVSWLPIIMNILVPLILLMFARQIADYFAKKLDDDAIAVEEDIINNSDLLEPIEE